MLEAFATKKGATAEGAAAIGEELSRKGVDSEVHLVREIRDLRPLGALVLRSAVNFGKWRKEAFAFGLRHAYGRLGSPVGLLEGGPTDASADEGKSVPAQAAAHRIRGWGRVMLGGRFLREQAGRFARKQAAGAGDFRDFERVRGWARRIGAEPQTC